MTASLWKAALLCSSLLALSACGGEVGVRDPRVTLALDFGSNALLELFVLDEASAPCAALLSGELAPDDESVVLHAAAARPAQGLNDGGQVSFELDELPADVALSFFARATEQGVTLSNDCQGDVVIPPDGHAQIELVVRETP